MPLADGVYSITNHNTKNCVTVLAEEGAYIAGERYAGGFDQQWNIAAKGDDTYFLQSLDPTFFAFLNPPAMQGQAIVTANRPVKWVIESVGSGRYSIRNPAGLVWQMISSNPGAKITLGPSTGSDAQSWSFQRLS